MGDLISIITKAKRARSVAQVEEKEKILQNVSETNRKTAFLVTQKERRFYHG
jgi:hypothetical protein